MYVYKMKKKKGAQRLQVANQQTTTLVSRSNISAESVLIHATAGVTSRD
jgi:hypothetical protein